MKNYTINVAVDYRPEGAHAARWMHESRIVLPDGTSRVLAVHLCKLYGEALGADRMLTLTETETTSRQIAQ